MTMTTKEQIVLTSLTTLEWNSRIYDCCTGKGGVRTKKVEGDGATPAGTFPLRQVLYRPDRIHPFACDLSMVSLSPDDGWCDDPTNSAYNCLIKRPYPGHHEALWREDNIYDIILVIGYNDSPPVAPKGSAIFIHIMNEQATPTDGCIALSRGDLMDILEELSPTTHLMIPDNLDETTASSLTQEHHI